MYMTGVEIGFLRLELIFSFAELSLLLYDHHPFLNNLGSGGLWVDTPVKLE